MQTAHSQFSSPVFSYHPGNRCLENADNQMHSDFQREQETQRSADGLPTTVTATALYLPLFCLPLSGGSFPSQLPRQMPPHIA